MHLADQYTTHVTQTDRDHEAMVAAAICRQYPHEFGSFELTPGLHDAKDVLLYDPNKTLVRILGVKCRWGTYEGDHFVQLPKGQRWSEWYLDKAQIVHLYEQGKKLGVPAIATPVFCPQDPKKNLEIPGAKVCTINISAYVAGLGGADEDFPNITQWFKQDWRKREDRDEAEDLVYFIPVKSLVYRFSL